MEAAEYRFMASDSKQALDTTSGMWANQIPVMEYTLTDQCGFAVMWPCEAWLSAWHWQTAEDLRWLLEICDSAAGSGIVLQRLEALNAGTDESELVWLLLRGARPLAMSRHGCRVLQRLVEVTSPQERDCLVQQLRPHVAELYESFHGNYVLAKLVEVLPPAAVEPIIQELESIAGAVARHKFGCRILQRLLEHGSEAQLCRLDALVAACGDLVAHPYGNYVMLHLIEHGQPHRREAVLQRLLPVLPELTQQRSGSFMTQRLLDHGSSEQRSLVVGAAAGSAASAQCGRFGLLGVWLVCCGATPDDE